MIPNKKANKIIKKIGGENPKQKKQQLQKVKKSIKKDLVETPEIELDEVKKLQNKNQSGNLEDAPDAVEQSEAEKEEDFETEECTEGMGQTVLVGSLADETTRTQLVTLFAHCGKIMSILFTAGSSAYIVLDSVEAADKAVKLNGTVLNGQQLVVEKPIEKQKLRPRISTSQNTVFVANLNYKTTKKGINDLFSSCGKIAYINILKYPGGKYNAFVCFKSPPEAVDLALKIDGNMLDKNPIKVLRYSPKFKSGSKVPLRGLKFKQNTTHGEKKSEFRGVKSGGIKKAPKTPKKKPNKKIASKE